MELEPAAAFPVFEIPSENELEKCGWQLVVLGLSFVRLNRNGHLLESFIIWIFINVFGDMEKQNEQVVPGKKQ